MNTEPISASKRFTRWARQRLLHSVTPDGFTPITEFSPEDIIVAGYPKSGNTWFQALIAGAVFGVLPEIVPMSVVQDLVPDVHATPWYKRHSKSMFFKSHHLPDPRYRRVVYLLRDGRDAMVSYWHFQQAIKGQTFGLLEFLKDESQFFPCKWHKHVQSWFRNPYHSEIMLVKYEDLKTDTVRELRRVCEFAGLERSDQVLQLAAESASFEKMRAREMVQGPYMKAERKDKLFCRRGQVGSHRDEMPPEALDEFMRDSAAMLQFTGYCGAGRDNLTKVPFGSTALPKAA